MAMNSQFATDPNRRPRETMRQVASFAVIGAASTVAYVAIYAWLRQGTPAAAANATALVITAIGNTAANRRLTFEVQGREGLVRDHAAGLLALGVALVITTTSLAAMDVLAPQRGRLVEIAVLVGANATATLIRFLLLLLAIDRRGDSLSSEPAVATLSAPERIHR
jgi:putative flippase GtrA